MFEVRLVDFTDDQEAQSFLMLLDMYARDPMGGSVPLSEDVKSRLVTDLPRFPGAVNLIAWHEQHAVGLLNAFTGYSTFKGLPLMNVHDIAVVPAWRGKGIGRLLLERLEVVARQANCCKITLEVLSGNTTARLAYERFGFQEYSLDPSMGTAVFMQKWLAQ